MKDPKKPAKKAVKKQKKLSQKFKITKPNGRVIFRENLGDYVKIYESKGCKVEGVE